MSSTLLNLKNSVSNAVHYLENNLEASNSFQIKIIVEKNEELLEKNAIEEVFTSAFALSTISHLLSKKTVDSLIQYILPKDGHGCVNYHKNERHLPDDLDTNSTVYSELLGHRVYKNGRIMRDMARLIILNTTPHGVIQCYLPPRGQRVNRICPGVVANCLRFLYLTDYYGDAMPSEDYIFNFLEEGKFENYSYYSPDVIIFYITRAVICNKRALLRFRYLLLESIKKQHGKSSDIVDISARVMSIGLLGEIGRSDMRKIVKDLTHNLLSTQKSDGSFPFGIFYKEGRHNVAYGGSVVSTIFALSALSLVTSYLQNINTNGQL